MIDLFLLMWLLFGIFAAGIYMADEQGRYPEIAKRFYSELLWFSLGIGIMGGPITAIVMIFVSRFLRHGWTLRRIKDNK